MNILRTLLASFTLAAIASAAPASAGPTPMPGGANQLAGLTGSVGQTLWNGKVRMTLLKFRDATPAETKAFSPTPGKRVYAFDVRISNGTNDSFTDLIEYTAADASGVAVDVPTSQYTHANLNILQAASVVQKGFFQTDPDFVPSKLIARCVTCQPGKFGAMRFAVKP